MAEDKHALCCRPGQAWEGEPVGMEVKFGGLDAYLTKPKQLTGKAVLMVADVMGWDFKVQQTVALRCRFWVSEARLLRRRLCFRRLHACIWECSIRAGGIQSRSTP